MEPDRIPVGFGEALRVWLKIGCLGFGGPAGHRQGGRSGDGPDDSGPPVAADDALEHGQRPAADALRLLVRAGDADVVRAPDERRRDVRVEVVGRAPRLGAQRVVAPAHLGRDREAGDHVQAVAGRVLDVAGRPERRVRALERREKNEKKEEGPDEGWFVRVAPADEWIAVSRRQLAAVREALAR